MSADVVRELVLAAVAVFSGTQELAEQAVRAQTQLQTSDRLEWLTQGVLQIDEQVLATASEITPEALGSRRGGFVASGGYSLMDPWAMISTPSKLLTYLPRSLLIGLFAPFPRQWFDTKGSTGIMRLLAGGEMLLLYLLWLSIGVGIWRALASRRPEPLFVLMFILLTAIPISLVVANMGTLFRLRLQFLLPLLLFTALGDPLKSYATAGSWLTRVILGRTSAPASAAADRPSGEAVPMPAHRS